MSQSDDSQKKQNPAPHLSDLILNSLKPRMGKETSKWIAGLADDSVQEAAEAAAKEQDATSAAAEEQAAKLKPPGKFTSILFLENLFDNFQQYEYDFNRSVAGTDWTISIERAHFAHETIKHQFKPSELMQVFRGRISTRYYTLVLRARPEIIEGWIIPIDRLFSFSADGEEFPRFLCMESKTEGDDIRWFVDDTEILWGHMRKFAKQLFGALVRVAKGEASETDVFTLRKKPAATPDQSDVIHSGEFPTYSFDEHNPDFDSPFINKQPSSSTAAPPPAARPAAAPAGSSIDSVAELLNKVITKELETLSTRGAAAFAQQDMATVETTFKRTTRVKQLHEEMAETLEKWRALLKEALEA